MIRKLDAYLIDRLDSVTTMLQKRGILLTQVRAGASIAAFVSMVAGHIGRPGWMIFHGVIFGTFAAAQTWWANRNKDYPENVRKMRELNAQSLLFRERELFWRCWFGWGAVFCLAVDLIWPSEATWVADMGIVFLSVTYFLMCCTFIGPGEFARERKTKLSALPSEV